MDDDDDGDDDGHLDNKYHVGRANIVNRCFKEAHSIPEWVRPHDIEIILPNTMMIVHLDVDFWLKEVLVSLRHREYGRIDQFHKRD